MKAKKKAKGYGIKKRGRSKRKFTPLTKKQEKMVKDNLDLVNYLVYSALVNTNWNTGSFTKADLKQVAFFAMCVAAKDYREDTNASYRTYAQSKIRGYIIHELRDNSRMTPINRKIMTIRNSVKEELDNGLTFKETAEKLGITVQEVYLCDTSWLESWASFDYEYENGLSLEPVYTDEDSVQCSNNTYNLIQTLEKDEYELLLNFFKETNE